MRYQRDKFSVESQRKKGQKPPDWYLNQPQLWPGDNTFLQAFWRLSTERQVGMASGPIPWLATMQYAAWLGLDDDNTRFFVGVIEALDEAYIEWQTANPPPPKPVSITHSSESA